MHWKGLGSLFASVALAMALAPALAFADDAAGEQAGGQLNSAAAQEAAVTLHEVDTCYWYVREDGTLVIGPSNGVEGEIKAHYDEYPYDRYYNPDSGSGRFKPFWSGNPDVRAVEIVGKVKAETCGYFFSYLTNLERIDFSGLDTSGATDMSHMFEECGSLESIDLSGLDTSAATDMSHMFDGCSSLQSVDLSGFDTSNVEGMIGMFQDCAKLKELDLHTFSVAKAKRATGDMFRNCTSLETIYADDSWDVDEGYSNRHNFSSGRIFENCINLKGPLGTTIDTPSVEASSDFFARVDKQYRPGLLTYKGPKTLMYDAKVTFAKERYAIEKYSVAMPTPIVTMRDGKQLKKGRDFGVYYVNNTTAGTATAYVIGEGDYVGSAVGTFEVVVGTDSDEDEDENEGVSAKKAPKITASTTKKTVRKAAAKKKAQTISMGAKSSSGGKLSYKVLNPNAKVSFKAGKATLKKGVKPGKYSIKVRVTSAAKGSYAPGSKDFAITFTVKR